MPRHYAHGGRATGSAAPARGRERGAQSPRPEPRTLRERFKALRNLPPFLRELWATSPPMLVADLALRLLRAALPVLTLYIGKLIIDETVALVRAGIAVDSLADAFAAGRLNRLGLFLLLEFAVAVVSDLLGRLVSLFDSLLSERYTNRTSIRLMEHAATLDLEDFEDSEMQDRIDRARRQTMSRAAMMGQLFGQAQDLVTIASFAAGLVVFAPWLIALVGVALVPAFLGESHFNAQSYALNYARTPERRILDYVRLTGASVESAKEVKIFGLNAFLVERYRTLADAFYADNRALARRRALWGSLFAALGTIAYYAAYAWIAWRTLRGEFSIGDLTFLSGSFRRLRNLLENFLIGFSQLAGQALYLNDLYSFFETRAAIVSPPDPRPFPHPVREGFVFVDVGFRYPGAETWAVRGLSFTLRAGEVLALVGENGAGKTTVVKLLARLYDPDEGRILLDGRDLREYDLRDLRAHVGVIFQDFVRYAFTAAENVAVGRIDARADRERIVQAAEEGLADPVIRRLPQGYDQVMGKRFRDGVDLSGGEWQKIAIARAYMREADLLILDEPTAALDARSEFQVFQRFKDLAAGKTAVLISHRFSTVRMADRILVLDGGRMEEMGTHADLLAAGKRYAELFELQAAGYR
jgi:ATP-binding cassette, subfamily B, bacterial